jgi:hypothetical protein
VPFPFIGADGDTAGASTEIISQRLLCVIACFRQLSQAYGEGALL